MQMGRFAIPRNKIGHIFISHLHGDHIFGLPGLLFSFAMNGREKPLHIHSPAGLKKMTDTLLLAAGEFPYPIHFHEVNPNGHKIIFENKELTVATIPLKHRIPTCGYLFREKPFLKNIRPEKITEHGLSIPQIIEVKNGQNIVLGNGKRLPNKELVFPPKKPRSFAFVSDTLFHEAIIPIIKNTDLLYHETTFCEDNKENATRTMHSTAAQAAAIAKRANAGTLVTGHYSSRYKNLDCFLAEAKPIFPETELGEEGRVYEVEMKVERG